MRSVRYLTIEEALYIHHRLIKETGGSHGLRDPDRLASAIERPRTGIGEVQIFPTMFLKAAALMESIIRDHPFVDGNKRTGITAARMFLAYNGWTLRPASRDLEDYPVSVAVDTPDTSAIAGWLEANSHPDPDFNE